LILRGLALCRSIASVSSIFMVLYMYLKIFYPPFASIAKGEVFGLLYVCLFVCLFVNDFSATRGPIHAKVRMQAYSGSGRVFSPFGGWRPLAGGKGANEIFVTMGVNGEFLHFGGF